MNVNTLSAQADSLYPYQNIELILQTKWIPAFYGYRNDTASAVKYENYIYNNQSPIEREYSNDYNRIKSLTDSIYIKGNRGDFDQNDMEEIIQLFRKHWLYKQNDHRFLYYYGRICNFIGGGAYIRAKESLLKAAKIAPLFHSTKDNYINKIYEEIINIELFQDQDNINIDSLMLYMKKFYMYDNYAENFYEWNIEKHISDHPLKFKVDSLANAYYPNNENPWHTVWKMYKNKKLINKEAEELASLAYSRGNKYTAYIIYQYLSYENKDDDKFLLRQIDIAKELNMADEINSNYLSLSLMYRRIKATNWDGWTDLYDDWIYYLRMIGDEFELAKTLESYYIDQTYNLHNNSNIPLTDFSKAKIDSFSKNLIESASIYMNFGDSLRALRIFNELYILWEREFNHEGRIDFINNYLLSISEEVDPIFCITNQCYENLSNEYYDILDLAMAKNTQKRFEEICDRYCTHYQKVSHSYLLLSQMNDIALKKLDDDGLYERMEKLMLDHEPVNVKNVFPYAAISEVIYMRINDKRTPFNSIKNSEYWFKKSKYFREWLEINSPEDSKNYISIVEGIREEINIGYLIKDKKYAEALKFSEDILSKAEYKLKTPAPDGSHYIDNLKDHSEALINYAKILFEMERFDEALDYYLLAIDNISEGANIGFQKLYSLFSDINSIYYIKKDIVGSISVTDVAIEQIESRNKYLVKGQNIKSMDFLVDWYDNSIINYYELSIYDKALDHLENSKSKQFKYKLGINFDEKAINFDEKAQALDQLNINKRNDIIIGFDLINEKKTHHSSIITFPKKWEDDPGALSAKIDTNALILGDDLLLTYMISKNKNNEIMIDYFSIKDVDKHFKDQNGIRNALKIYHSSLISNSSDIDMLSKKIYDVLMSPIEDKFKNKKNITIIPDANFAYLPFETLQDKWGNYLIEDHNIKYIQSIRTFSKLSNKQKQSFSKDLIAFGGANYQKNEINENSFRSVINDLDAMVGNLVYRDELPNLPGSKDEVESIAKFFNKKAVFTGESASEAIVKKLDSENDLKNYKYIHFAAHGRSYKNDSKNTAIVLSLTQDALENEDGFLTSDEIQNLDLNGNFVTLSACETAIGKKYISEGVIGLNYSFIAAGAHAVTSTLWRIPDNSSNLFMKSLYKKISKKKSYSEALTITKRDFLKGKYGKDYSSPSIWAPFIYYGL